MTTKQYKKLNKRDKVHLSQCFSGSPSKVTLSRIRDAITYQAHNDIHCYDCKAIARKLGLEV